MMRVLSVLFLLIAFTNVQGQQNNACRIFHTGTFRYDSENPELKNTVIVRQRTRQEEIDPDGKKLVLRIRWKSDCEYQMKFLKSSTMESPLIGKTMRVKIIAIEGNRYQYAVQMEGLPIITGWIVKTGN